MKNKKEIVPADSDQVMISLHYRFVKLVNGDDLICQVPTGLETDVVLLVRHPVKVMVLYDPQTSESVYAFYPWVPFTSQEIIGINKMSILAITTVRNNVRLLYDKRVTEILAGTTPIQSVDEVIQKHDADMAEFEPEPDDPGALPVIEPKVWIN